MSAWRTGASPTPEFLAAVVECSDDAIITKDLNGLVTSWNNSAERIFGYTAEEMIGQPVSIIAPPDRIDEMPIILGRIRNGERIDHYQTIRRTKDRRLLNISLTISPIKDANGRIIGASEIARDITEQVRAAERVAELNTALVNTQEELHAINQALLRANEDLNQFAFAASHDLQEPLRMITNYSQLLLKRCRDQLSEETSSWIEFINESTNRMHVLLADLLAYTRLSGDARELSKSIDLNLVFQKVIENCKAAIDESHASVTSDYLPTVHGYEPHFVQLFQNLIGNALKYRGEQTPRIRVSAVNENGMWRLAVADNGIGIDPQYHHDIFGIFTRLHGKTIPGTGIGLAICQRVVERYGGRIWVQSQTNQGATFYFTLPTAKGAAA